jgi:hypothetical protein
MRFCSIFSQLLQLFPRSEFQRAVEESKAERHARGFQCWDQFVAMLFCQLAQTHSLREVCAGLASYKGKLCHLGLKTAPARSTLAYANEHRAVQLYETVFYQLLARCQQVAQGKGQGAKLRFKNKLVSVDASTIELCATIFDWAKFRRTKGAVKREPSNCIWSCSIKAICRLLLWSPKAANMKLPWLERCLLKPAASS